MLVIYIRFFLFLCWLHRVLPLPFPLAFGNSRRIASALIRSEIQEFHHLLEFDTKNLINTSTDVMPGFEADDSTQHNATNT